MGDRAGSDGGGDLAPLLRMASVAHGKALDDMSGKPFASWKDCRGAVSWGSHSLDVEFDLAFGQTTEITFTFKDIAAAGSAGVLDLYNVYNAKTSSVEVLDLEATTPDGHQLKTDSLYLTAASLNANQDGTHLTFMGSAGFVEIEFTQAECEVEDRGRVAFYTQGQRAFGPGVTGTCELGTVSVQGDHSPDDFSQLTVAVR